MKRLGTIFALSLAMMLALTSLTLAVARGQAPAVGEVVICTGMGLQVLHLDAEGNPVGAPHVCPDGIASFIAADAPMPVMPLRRLSTGERLTILTGIAQADLHRSRATARGPPEIA